MDTVRIFCRLPFLILVHATVLFLSSTTTAQNIDYDYLFQSKPILVEKYIPDSMNRTKVVLPTDFNSAEIKNKNRSLAFAGKKVTKVELVYSTYRLSKTFSQPELNQKRIEALRKLSPDLFKSTVIEWKFIGQTAAKNEDDAKQLFHGFVITFLPAPDKEFARREFDYFKSLIHSDSLGKDSLVETVKYRLKKKRFTTGLYYPNSARKRAAGITYEKKGIWNRKPKYSFQVDTIATVTSTSKVFVPSRTAMVYVANLPDSVIFRVLDRKKEWKNMLFVCDVTGSMAPYSAELMIWNKLNFNTGRGKYFTFFNDGDNKPDKRKVIGKTGGIYHVEAKDYEDVEKQAMHTIRKGSGGDAPENNLEAILEATTRFPDASEIVLIADNWANIKDLELLKKVNRPVHVILCGIFNGLVNADYVQLAWSTKGSVHTMEEDIENLALLNEGGKIRIGNNTFKLEKGKFVLIQEL